MTATAQFQPTGNEVKQAAFHEQRRTGRLSQSRWRVLREFFHGGPATRNQIADRASLPLSSVCGRCRELYDMGYIEPVGTVRVEGGHARQKLALTDKGVEAVAQMMSEGGDAE